MNLRAIANSQTQAINPNYVGTVTTNTGYSVGTNGKQIPGLAPPYAAEMQVQPLSTRDLKHLEALNVQGSERAVYINGVLAGANRADLTGGDLVTFNGKTWLVTGLIEPWNSAGWCKVGVAQQVVP